MMKNTHPKIANFISSQQTVTSEIQERAISLGKAIVEELGLERDVDTLSRWIIHYVAEQIALVEKGSDLEKMEAKQRCFETILKLWQHRSYFPNDRYPFKRFEAIFETLNRLDPDHPTSYYFDSSYFKTKENDDAPENLNNEVKLWLNLALAIDNATRVLIDFALRQVAYHSVDETTTTWLEKAADIADDSDYDISMITHLVEDFEESEPDEAERQKIRQQLVSRIEKLDQLVEYSELLRNDLNKHLENL